MEAVKEFDRLGRDKFIKKVSSESLSKVKMGVQKSRDYVLLYKEKLYDSKPIVQYAFLKAINKFCAKKGISSYSYSFYGGDRGNTAGGLLKKLGFEVVSLKSEQFGRARKRAEDREEEKIKNDHKLDKTTKKQLIEARRGQGRFRKSVLEIEKKCRVTDAADECHLRASHIKPWADADNEERLDGNNGLLLAPHIDHLFDKGYISFTDEGNLLIAEDGNVRKILKLWHIKIHKNYGSFNDKQKEYLEYHRDHVFKGNGRVAEEA